jgi:tetratricopeptide (TPR) repeat protein
VDESREAVELVAFDSSVYYIAPSSNDKKTLKELIQNLSPHAMHSYIADEKTMRTKLKGSIVLTVSGNKPVDKREIENRKEHWRYFPLFYFPLGLAMILTALALSSMTKRQSVSIMFIVMILLGERDANAGVMDFRILDRATIAYENGEYEQSVRLFSEYQRLNDTPQVRYNLANALFKAGHYQKARYWYKSVVTNDPMLKEWVRINTALLPAEKGETAQDLAQKKVDLELKTDSKKGNKIVNIVNTTPLFVY